MEEIKWTDIIKEIKETERACAIKLQYDRLPASNVIHIQLKTKKSPFKRELMGGNIGRFGKEMVTKLQAMALGCKSKKWAGSDMVVRTDKPVWLKVSDIIYSPKDELVKFSVSIPKSK